MILPSLALSESGRAVLLDGEIERLIAKDVDMKFYPVGGVESNQAEKYKVTSLSSPDCRLVCQQGRMVLTSHRILWIDRGAQTSPGLSCCIPLAAVQFWRRQESVAAKLRLKEEKIKFQVYGSLDKRPVEGGINAVGYGTIALTFSGGIPSNFEAQLRAVLADASWTVSSKKEESSSTKREPQSDGVHPLYLQQLIQMGFDRNRSIRALKMTGNKSVPEAVDWVMAFEDDPSLDQPMEVVEQTPERSNIKAGIGDIMKQQEAKLRESNASLDVAFQDLNGLMSMAQEMVRLAEKFRSGLSSDPTKDDDLLDQETITEMISMGIASPVTKETAGALYHEELCRQLADFLVLPLEKVGGMMTLPDVYCRFNRGRGMELVSPDDLIQATHLFEKMQIPLRLRSFPSGVTVVQSTAHDDEEVCRRIAEFIRPSEASGLSRPLIASDLVHAFNIPLTIAQEHLFLAEEKEVLCRDDSHDGLRFYFNFFFSISC